VALGELGDVSAVEPLIGSLGKEYCGGAAALALGKLKDKRAVAPLINAFLRNGRDLVALAQALGQLGDGRAARPLLDRVEDEYYGPAIAEALGRLGDASAVEGLICSMGGGPQARLAAAEALGRLGEPRWRALVRGDQGDFERLGECDDPRALGALIRALSCRRDPEARRAAASVLVTLAKKPSNALLSQWSRIGELFGKEHQDSHADSPASPAYVASCGSSFGGSSPHSDDHTDEGFRQVGWPPHPPRDF
jgi:HEAT repeat protein